MLLIINHKSIYKYLFTHLYNYGETINSYDSLGATKDVSDLFSLMLQPHGNGISKCLLSKPQQGSALLGQIKSPVPNSQRHRGAREPDKQRSSAYINNTKKGSCCSPHIFQPKATAAMFRRELEQKLFAKSDLVKGRIKY